MYLWIRENAVIGTVKTRPQNEFVISEEYFLRDGEDL